MIDLSKPQSIDDIDYIRALRKIAEEDGPLKELAKKAIQIRESIGDLAIIYEIEKPLIKAGAAYDQRKKASFISLFALLIAMGSIYISNSVDQMAIDNICHILSTISIPILGASTINALDNNKEMNSIMKDVQDNISTINTNGGMHK